VFCTVINRLLLRETLYYSISKAVPGFIGLLSVILFMRIIGAQEYGQYSLLISQCNLIVALGFGWLNQSQLRYYSKDNSHDDYIISQTKALFYCKIICLIILSFMVYYQSLSIRIFVLSLIAIISIGVFNYIKIFYQARLLPRNIIVYNTCQSILSLLIPLLLMYYWSDTATTLIMGVALSFLITILILMNVDNYGFSIWSFEKRIEKNVNLVKKWFAYGSPLSLWFAAGLALPFLDRIFINYYLPSSELGIYSSLQEILVRSFSLTLFPFILALHPRIMHLWNKSKQKKAGKLMLNCFYIFLSLGLLFLSIFWYYDNFIFFIISKAIPEITIQSKTLILPLFFAGFLWQLSFLTHKMFELKEQTVLMTIAIIPSLIINFIGNNYFLPKLGGVATAYTALFSALTYCIITSIHFIYSIKKIRIL